jgi:molybdopterin converting factor small subunit
VAKVRIPAAMRVATGGKATLTVQASTVLHLLQLLELQHPALAGYLLDSKGGLHSHICVFVDDEDCRGLRGPHTEVSERSQVTILVPIAGGNTRSPLSDIEIRRYGRQLLLPWMSGAAQTAFSHATAVIALPDGGSIAAQWCAMYLAAAGVGQITLIAAGEGLVCQLDIAGSPLLPPTHHGMPLASAICAALSMRFAQCRIHAAPTTTAHNDFICDFQHAEFQPAIVMTPYNRSLWQAGTAAALWLKRVAAKAAL